MSVPISLYTKPLFEKLKNIRTFIGEFEKKSEVLDWIQECRLYALLTKNASLYAVSAGKKVVISEYETKEIIIEFANELDILNWYEEILNIISFYQEKIDSLGGKSIRISKYGTLGKFENVVKGWHTIDRHTNKTIDDLLNRLYNSKKRKDKFITASSAFYPVYISERDVKNFKDESRSLAEDSVGKALSFYEEEITSWLDGNYAETEDYESDEKEFVINGFSSGNEIGFVIPKGQYIPQFSEKVKIVLKNKFFNRAGFAIKTSFPVL